MLMAPSLMGFVVYFSDWKLGFLMLVPIITILLIILNKIDYEWVSEKSHVDYKGSVIYISLMIMFTYEITILDEMGIVFLIVCLILLVAFIKIERKVAQPLINFKMIRDARFSIGNYAAMVTYFTVTIVTTTLSLHLQFVLDYEELIVGLILIIAPIIMIGMSGLSGQLSNRIDPRIISGVAMMCICASATILFFIDFVPFSFILIA